MGSTWLGLDARVGVDAQGRGGCRVGVDTQGRGEMHWVGVDAQGRGRCIGSG